VASQYRLKRGPAVALLLLVGVVGALLLARGSVKPGVDVYAAVTVPAAYDGTTYAFDGLVCLRGSSVGASVRGVSGGRDTRIGLRPADAAVTVAFPVAQDAVRPLDGADVPAGDQQCTRVLVSPHGQGEQRAGQVRVSFRYGPFGLLRTTARVTPPVTLQVTGRGQDPRASA